MSIFGNKFLGNKATDSVRDGLPAEHPAGPSVKSDAEWRQELTPRNTACSARPELNGPLPANTGTPTPPACTSAGPAGAELFTSNEKFDSHCGWPSFWAPLAEGTVRYIHDRTLGMERIEVRCATCDSHLGHVFEGEGYATPTDQRYCINSISLKLVPRDEQDGGTADDPGTGS